MKTYFKFFIQAQILSLAFTSFSIWASEPFSSSEARTAKVFQKIHNSPELLATFINLMPKGGDLHNHESGATYAENLFKYAVNDNLCVDRTTYTVLVNPACASADLLENAITVPAFKDELVDAWSMRHFKEDEPRSGHDHFFATFGKYGAIASAHHGEILAEIAERAALENESYLEIMTTADGNESGKLAKTLGWDPDFNAMRVKLLAAGFDRILNDISTTLNNDEIKMKQVLACDSASPKKGCSVKIRFLYQVLREQDPEMVFGQLLAGFEAASKDPRVVGLNMVQPEDGPISMRDYDLQMQMVGYLHQVYPNVHISLHAGELNKVVAPKEGLKFHIKDAVEVAHAERIGHGVDILSESKHESTLLEMAQQHKLVEINLTSNAKILDISGDKHPIRTYLTYGVPVTLSTDDEGVSRSNLTKEYIRAASTYNFDYLTLKYFARNSLEYSFLPGDALWRNYQFKEVVSACAKDALGAEHPSKKCQAFLDVNEKASMQWNLETRFNIFESYFIN